MKARVGSTDIISGGRYTTRETDGDFTIDLDHVQDNGLHTLVIYDKDTPHPYIHYLRVNIQDGNLTSGFESMSYVSPNPPLGVGSHNYVILLYKQYLPYEEVNLEDHRDTFNLISYIKENYGGELSRIEFFVSKSKHMSDNTSAYDPMVSDTRMLHHQDLLLQDRALSEDEQKYCSCLLKVESKGSARNPYAVCAKAVGTTSRDCSKHYNYEAMPDDLLRAYMNKEKLNIPKPWNRQQALDGIRAFLSGK